MSGWTDVHDEAARVFLKDGMSASQCADELNRKFGLDLSRNAVISRAKRKQLGLRSKTSILEASKPAAKTPKKRVRKPPRSPKLELLLQIRPPLQPHQGALRCAEIVPKHLSLLETTDLTCKWPYGGWPGNDPITYCGHPTAAGFPYCLDHARLSIGPGTATERKAGHFRLQAL